VPVHIVTRPTHQPQKDDISFSNDLDIVPHTGKETAEGDGDVPKSLVIETVPFTSK